MNDTIYRQEAINEIMSLIEEPDDDFNEGVRCSAAMIYQLPPAQPQCRTGRWIRKTDTRFGEMLNDILICSECGIAFPTLNMIRRSYCPNCGSKMKEK